MDNEIGGEGVTRKRKLARERKRRMRARRRDGIAAVVPVEVNGDLAIALLNSGRLDVAGEGAGGETRFSRGDVASAAQGVLDDFAIGGL